MLYLFRDILDADGSICLLRPSHKGARTGEEGRTRNEEGHGGGGAKRHQEGDEGRSEGKARHINQNTVVELKVWPGESRGNNG